MMNRQELAESIRSIGKDCEIREGRQFIEVTVQPARLHELAKQLKEREETSFDYLTCLTGVDYGQELCVVYHIRSARHGHTMVLKVHTRDRINPQLESVTDIWKSAEYHEREVYDLLGIRFINHPDLRRLFLHYSWGFPLRKDYTDERNTGKE